MDVKKNLFAIILYIIQGIKRNYNPIKWAKIWKIGAGEILVTSINNEGMSGFDLNLIMSICDEVISL